MSGNGTPINRPLTVEEKRTLYRCSDCSHLLVSHDGAGCMFHDEWLLRCSCEARTETIETTYESVAELLASHERELRAKIRRDIQAAKPPHMTRNYTAVDEAYDAAAMIALGKQ